MGALEIVLLVGGVVILIVSFFVDNKSKDNDNGVAQIVGMEAGLTEADIEKLKKQIDDIIEDKLADIAERTEASLDKISNTKILELNDYADTIIKEINKNHNETVFLYDMLNEKAKEVKNTVKDVNLVRKEADKLVNSVSQSVTATDSVEPKTEQASGINIFKATMEAKPKAQRKYGYRGGATSGSKDLAKERLMEIMRKNETEAAPKNDIVIEETAPTADVVEAVTAPEVNVEVSSEADVAVVSEVKAEENAADVAAAMSEDESDAVVVEEKPKRKRRIKKEAVAEAEMTSVEGSADETDVSGNVFSSLMESIEEGMTNNQKIVSLSKQGMSNKEIAKLLNIGVGEVKLVVDLHNSSR